MHCALMRLLKLRNLIITLFALLLFQHIAFSQVNLNNGLVAYYPFNGNANDASGNGNNGTPMNGVQMTTDRFGNSNSAYLFDGADDYISVPNSASLNPQNAMSIALYFNPSRNGTQVMLGKVAYTGTTATQYQLSMDVPANPGVKFGVNAITNGCSGTAVNTGNVSTNIPVSLNIWHCIVGTFDNGVQKIYLDGVLMQTINTGFTTLNACSNATIQIGKWWSLDPFQFMGKIDDIRIYNRAINQDEVNALCIQSPVIASFDAPDTVCVNTPVTITNTSQNVTNYYWNFCSAGTNTTPQGTNLGTIGGALQTPVFIDYVKFNGDHYGFVINHVTGNLVRLDFGTSLLNTPTAVNLGKAGVIPNQAEGIQMAFANGRWYAIIVGGSAVDGTGPRIVKIDFGPDLRNTSPVGTNWGNLGGLSFPGDLHLFNDNGSWYGLVTDINNSIIRFSFGTSFQNPPIATNLGNIGNMNTPNGIYAVNDNGQWHVFVSARNSSSITRLDFGNSLLNTPTGVNLGNPGGLLNLPRDISIMKSCGEIVGFVVNEGSNSLVKLDFASLTASPVATSLGNVGNFSFPHSISKIFREGNDIYAFILNVSNNTLSRIRFEGCSSSSILNSTAQNPPPVIYQVPGIYNISLTADDGLPTQTAFCKQIVVVYPLQAPTKNIEICQGDSVKIGSSSPVGPYLWSTGDVSDSIHVKAEGTYWVEMNYYGCVYRDSVNLTIDMPPVQASNDTIVCKGSIVQLNASGAQDYSWSPVQDLSATNIANPVATPVATTEYIVTGTNINGCTAKDTVLVDIFSDAAISLTNDTLICKNSSVQLFAGGGTVYSWTPGGTLSNTSIPNPVASPVVDTKYYVEITDNNSCKYLDSVAVSIKPLPVFSISNPVQVCLNDSAQLTASGGDLYSWQPVDGLGNNSIANPRVSPMVNTTYTVTITETTCNESATLSTTVTVLPLPDVQATKSNDIDCSNDQAQLNATGGQSYSWSPSSNLSNSNAPNPIARPTLNTQFIVKGTDVNGCHNFDSVTVNVDNVNRGGYLMPTAFTPNGDGLNDCYGIRFWGVIQEVDFSIYNRWGQRIFYTKDPFKCWDGTFRGVKQGTDVFVYVIRAKTSCDDAVFRKGTFTLIR